MIEHPLVTRANRTGYPMPLRNPQEHKRIITMTKRRKPKPRIRHGFGPQGDGAA